MYKRRYLYDTGAHFIWCRDGDKPDIPAARHAAAYLPLVFDLFGEAEEVSYGENGAVVQRDAAGEAAKNLMLVRFDDDRAGQRTPVEHGREVHVEAVVVAGEVPDVEIGIAALFVLRDVEFDRAQLVDPAVIEQDVFRRGGGVAEAVADVPAERHTVQLAGGAAPVP